MKREILCRSCASKPPVGLNLDDHRALIQFVVTPPDHSFRVDGYALHEMRCDNCNATILPSDDTTCVSTWNSGGYFSWETDYVRLKGHDK